MSVEYLDELVADKVIHRLHVELGSEPFLDAVDDRQLCGALVGLYQQPLRLVEQPRVFQGDAQASSQRVQEPHIGLAERVRTIQVLEGDPPEGLVARYQRYVQD